MQSASSSSGSRELGVLHPAVSIGWLLKFSSSALEAAYWKQRSKSLMLNDWLTSLAWAIMGLIMVVRFAYIDTHARAPLYAALSCNLFWQFLQLYHNAVRPDSYVHRRPATAVVTRAVISITGVVSISQIYQQGEWNVLAQKNGMMPWGEFVLKACGKFRASCLFTLSL